MDNATGLFLRLRPAEQSDGPMGMRSSLGSGFHGCGLGIDWLFPWVFAQVFLDGLKPIYTGVRHLALSKLAHPRIGIRGFRRDAGPFALSLLKFDAHCGNKRHVVSG